MSFLLSSSASASESSDCMSDGFRSIDLTGTKVYTLDSQETLHEIDLVKLFSDAGYLLFVVTNQSGIGRGYYTENDFILLTAWMKEKFMENSISIQAVYHCPHTPDNACLCRKPNTGMIQEALKTYSIDRSEVQG